MTVPATYSPPAALLSEFDNRLQMRQAESLSEAIKRVTLEQLEWGAAGFFDGEEQFAGAVHESRKSIKRIRSLLRLIRYDLPQDVYRYEDRSLQKTGRMISEVRSASALAATANMIEQLYGDFLAAGAFEEMIAKLEARRDILELHALEDPNLVARVVRNLERAYHRYSSWPTDPEARAVYGLGIRDGYQAIAPGLRNTYSRGRREMVIAFTRTSPDAFHSWRKRAKYLRHQMEFLAPIWPEAIAGVAVTLDRLGELLGEDHDLQELNELIHSRNDLCPDPRERSLFAALISQRRSELQVAAEVLGRRVYAEKPAWLEHRFGEYWESRALIKGRHVDTLAIS